MHTVFINDKPLHFINTYDKGELESAKEHLIFSEHDKSIEEVIVLLENNSNNGEIFYLSENADSSWEVFLSFYSLIEAAGGLVKNPQNNFLIIYRLGKWDLPKGKLEYDETPEQAAMREVQEECGVGGLSIVEKLPLTFHTYTLNKKRKLKKAHWFLMKTEKDSVLVPQAEEGIEDALWMNQKEIESKVIPGTYASIAELLRRFFSTKS